MRQPTERQIRVLRAVWAHVAEQGYPPTVRELRERLGFSSTNGVSQHLEALVRKGMVVRRPNRSRSLRLTEAGATWLGEQACPACGRGAA